MSSAVATRSEELIRIRWRRFLTNLGSLILSMLLALIIWLIAITQENPLVQREYDEAIPVSVRNIDESLALIQNLRNRTVTVTLRAPERAFDELTANDFSAYIDLEGLEEGVHDVDVTVSVVDPQVKVLSVQAPKLHVELDQVSTRLVKVQTLVNDQPAAGYEAKAPIVEPISVTVTGPETLVEQVGGAVAQVQIDGAKSQVDREVDIVLVDSQDREMSQVIVEPAVVRVVVPVEQRDGRKEVAVRPNLIGQPANGYRLSSVRVDPSTVVLIGDNETLTRVPGFIETTEVALEGATADIEARLDLVLPDNVQVSEQQDVIITASIVPLEGGRTLKQEPVTQNLGANLDAEIALKTVEVILRGPVPLLESMEPDDMFVILDLADLLPGVHNVEPSVVLPNGIEAEGVLPETVEVVITASEVAAPVAPEAGGNTENP